MNTHKTLLICLVLLFIITGIFPMPVTGEVVERIVAVVNDDIITLTDLKKATQPLKLRIDKMRVSADERQRLFYEQRKNVLKQLIENKLAEQEVENLALTVDEEEIDNAIERIKEMNYLTDEELRAALQREGTTLELYREELKKQILKEKLINYEVKVAIVITDRDMQTYYNNHLDQYGGELTYRLRNILMRVPDYSDEDEKAIIHKRAKDVHEKLSSGQAFEDLARLYSESPVASNGGDLGWIAIDVFSPQIRRAIEPLDAGEFTSILDTDQGYQIFYVEEISRSKGKTFEEAAPKINEILYNEAVNKRYKEWIEELREKAHIKEKL